MVGFAVESESVICVGLYVPAIGQNNGVAAAGGGGGGGCVLEDPLPQSWISSRADRRRTDLSIARTVPGFFVCLSLAVADLYGTF
jgi:hypothetical protein